MECDHKWIDMEDRSLDRFCVKCSKKVKQKVAYLPLINNATTSNTHPSIQPIIRETITINTGKSNLGKISVYKDYILKEISKQFSIQTNFLK